MPITAAAISETHIPPVCRRPAFARSPRAASTGWITACWSGPTCTRCSTAGISTSTPGHRLLVSPRLREDFGNGDQFYAKAGEVIDLPERRTDRLRREFLEWHIDEVFKAS